KRIALLTTRLTHNEPIARAFDEAAARLGVELLVMPMTGVFDEANYRATFDEIVRRGAGAIYVYGSAEHAANRALVIRLIEAAGLPAIYGYIVKMPWREG